MNELQFTNDDLNLKVRTISNSDGSISINLEDAARGLGFVQTQNKNGKQYTSVRWERIKKFLNEFGVPPQVEEDTFIPESLFYLLAMKATNETAKKFQIWIVTEVFPASRKTNLFINKDELLYILEFNNQKLIERLLDELDKREEKNNIDYCSEHSKWKTEVFEKINTLARFYKCSQKKEFAILYQMFDRDNEVNVKEIKKTFCKEHNCNNCYPLDALNEKEEYRKLFDKVLDARIDEMRKLKEDM